jgi:hypothetical protein
MPKGVYDRSKSSKGKTKGKSRGVYFPGMGTPVSIPGPAVEEIGERLSREEVSRLIARGVDLEQRIESLERSLSAEQEAHNISKQAAHDLAVQYAKAMIKMTEMLYGSSD